MEAPQLALLFAGDGSQVEQITIARNEGIGLAGQERGLCTAHRRDRGRVEMPRGLARVLPPRTSAIS